MKAYNSNKRTFSLLCFCVMQRVVFVSLSKLQVVCVYAHACDTHECMPMCISVECMYVFVVCVFILCVCVCVCVRAHAQLKV